MERIDRKREEVNIEEVAEFLKENLDKEIFCFIIKKVLPMYSNYAMRRFNKRGFTLIELMVVVIIVGVLAAVAIPLYTGQVKNQKHLKAQHLLVQ